MIQAFGIRKDNLRVSCAIWQKWQDSESRGTL